MIFRNLETGVEWEVTNPDRIVELEKSNLYESVTTSKKEAVKPVEKETEKPMEEKPKAKKKETK